MYLSVHDAKDALCDGLVNKVITVRWPTHLSMVCFQADLFELTWKIQQCRMPLDDLWVSEPSRSVV